MLIRVLEIPAPTGNFHFKGGEPQVFIEVDWFRDDDLPADGSREWQERMTRFVTEKKYFDPAKAYLVLHPVQPFTINYSSP